MINVGLAQARPNNNADCFSNYVLLLHVHLLQCMHSRDPISNPYSNKSVL